VRATTYLGEERKVLIRKARAMRQWPHPNKNKNSSSGSVCVKNRISAARPESHRNPKASM
jgi:hypothetical protein